MNRIVLMLLIIPALANATAYSQLNRTVNDTLLQVKKTADFMPTGDGSNRSWAKAEWITLRSLKNNSPYETRFKIMYSDSGLYCLYYNEDHHITSTLKGDFENLYTEDVVEAFFWPDQSAPLYFEYELSPANYELPILVPNFKGKFLGWRPWHYDGSRRTRHAVHIEKGSSGTDSILSWTAEFFIPYELLKPLQNVPPHKGTEWKANFYRIDYDHGQSGWSWRPVNRSYHEIDKYGTLIFE